MGEIAALLPLIQGAAGAASSYEEGQSAKMVAGVNAGYARQQGQEAQRIGLQDAGRRLQQGGMDAGSAAARAASSGIRVDTGSAAQTQEDIKAAAAQDAATIRMNAAKQAWGYGVEAANYKSQGRFAEIAGISGAGQSIASGGLRYAQQNGFGQYKAPPGDGRFTYNKDEEYQ